MEEITETVTVESDIKSREHQCKSCANTFHGIYCNLCGEKIVEAEDRSFRTFTINFLAFADSKLLKTLWMIIRRPGMLSSEYAEGRRVKYLRPLQLFFILNLIYFLFPLLQLFNTSLKTQMYLRTHSPFVRSWVVDKVGTDPLALEGYTLMYNEKSNSTAKLLIIVFVVFASLPMALIYRNKNRFFTDHVTLALELTTFNLAINALALSVFLMAVNKLIHWTHLGWEKYLDDFTLTVIFILTNTYFLFSAGKTFYRQSGAKLLLKVVIGLFGLFVALELYRISLFVITYWSL